MPESKPSNPKDALGIKKVPASTIPAPVMAELGVAMLEGALKYGRHNYRVIGVRASVYYDAVMARHMPCWWEGEDVDPDSGVHHLTKAIASLVVLRDAMIQGTWVDDRPPPSPVGWIKPLNEAVSKLLEKYPNPVPPYLAADKPAPAPEVMTEAELLQGLDAYLDEPVRSAHHRLLCNPVPDDLGDLAIRRTRLGS